jgi:hypothetical protein
MNFPAGYLLQDPASVAPAPPAVIAEAGRAPNLESTKLRNHSSCLHGAQGPLQVIRLENPEKIWLFLLVTFVPNRLCLQEACLETDSSSASSDFSTIRASDFNISRLTSLLHTALAELKSLKELQHLAT